MQPKTPPKWITPIDASRDLEVSLVSMNRKEKAGAIPPFIRAPHDKPKLPFNVWNEWMLGTYGIPSHLDPDQRSLAQRKTGSAKRAAA